MKHNYLDNYELVNGYALIDTDFSIITANEKMYKFLGAVRKAAISDAIHQVDIDDFINVSNNLRIGQSKSMVLRMKRVDNSFRWVLMDIKRLYMSNNHKKEYLELNISDVIGLKNHTNHLNEDIGIYRRVLSINDKLVYTYEYDKDLFTIYNYVNDDAIAVISSTIDDVYERILKKGLIPAESIKEYTAYFNNIRNAKSVYQHRFSINVNYGDGLKPTGSYINGSTIYSQRKPIRSVGTLKLPDANNVFSKTTYDYEDCNKMLGREGLEKFVALIRTFFDQKGMHMQFNVVDRETLLDAQKHPEKYPQLTIRVSGYAVNFIKLTKEQQDDVIHRTFHGSL